MVLRDSLKELKKVFTQPDFLAAARQHAKGKLTIQEKVALLFDSGSFSEDLAPGHELDSRHGERRILIGYGRINNRLVSAAIFDSSIAAGALNIDMGEKLLQHMRRSAENRCPLLIDWDCGGGDIRNGIMVMDIFGRIFTQINELSGRIPTLSIISGLNAGGAAYASVMTDTVIMIDGSMIAVTGPVVIKVATGEEVTPDEMGGAELHAEKSGEAHYRVPDYRTAAQLIKRYFSYLPQNMYDFPPKVQTWQESEARPDLRAIVTRTRKNARLKRNANWDVRTFIVAAVDDDTWFEYHENYAPSVVVGFARIAGVSVSIIANQRSVLGGSMTAASSSKVTRFLRLANAYHLPVITLVDVPGFIATQAESEGQILSKGAALLMMYPNVMVPQISVVIDMAFGGAYCAMGSITTETERSRSRRHYGFPTGQIAVVGKEAGPFFTYGFNGGDAVMKDRLQQRYETEYLNMDMAFANEFVEPLEPEDLRKQLIEDVPKLYASYQDYWRKLVQELKHVQQKCPGIYKELRYGAMRGSIKPL
jgi:acetyl-CoA carboxylase carboxyltransferase component